MVEKAKHVGFPLPFEMFHDSEVTKREDFTKHSAICDLLDIDLTLNGHDLRVAEKNLQLYHQLSGRAGRAGKPATVYFQTYNTNEKMILDSVCFG